jgi:glucokinase
VNGRVLTAEGIELARNQMAPILAALVGGDLDAITPREMAIAARQGDEHVALAIERAARFLGIGIANAVSITAVDHVVITGGLGALGDLLLEPIRKAVRERVRMFPSDCVVIECSSIGDRAGALGALALAFQKHSNTQNMKEDPCV